MRLRPLMGVLGLVLLGGIGWYFWPVPQRELGVAPDIANPSSHWPLVPQRNPEDYVGNQVCARCHAEIAKHYTQSPMSHSWMRANSETLIDGSFSASLPATVADPHSPFVYQCRLENGRLIQEETLADSAINNYSRKYAAAYLVGSGNHARAMIGEHNGYFTQLPIGWFSQEGKWKLNPGYELANHRFDRPILPGCLACHGGYAAHQSPARNRYEIPATNGINCEHCHGPGKAHADWHENDSGQKLAKLNDPIINPKHLPAARSLDVCLQCHLQGDVVLYRQNADAFSFRPGESLTDHRLDYLIQTENPESFGVASHGSRLMRSRCFLGSRETLTCTTCHDPHRPVSDFSSADYNAKCQSCHQPEACNRPPKEEPRTQTDHCIACHMPQRETREGRHLVSTDHWIRSYSGNKNELSFPLLKPDARVTLVEMNTNARSKPQDIGAAYVQLHLTMGPQRPALARGVALLESAVQKDPGNSQTRYWLATGQVAQHQSLSAIAHLKQLLKEHPGWSQARFRLAVAYHQLKRYPEAIVEYERVLTEAPAWLEPYPLVIRLHLSQKNPQAALRWIKQQLSHQEDATAYLNLALAKHLQGKPLAQSLTAVSEALRLDPRNPTAWTTRAYLHLQAGQTQKAQSDYQQALVIDPKHPEAMTGLRAIQQGSSGK